MTAPEPTESAPVEDETPDLLELDSTGASPRALARLGLLSLAVAAGTFIASILLASAPAGSVLDLVVFVVWLAVVVLCVGGTSLLAAAGIAALIARRREPDQSR